MFELQMECNLNKVKKGNQENNALELAKRLFCNEGITASEIFAGDKLEKEPLDPA